MEHRKPKPGTLVAMLIVLVLALFLIICNIYTSKQKAEADSKPRDVEGYMTITGYEEISGEMILLSDEARLRLTDDIMIDEGMLYAVKNRITGVTFSTIYVMENATDPGPYRAYTLVSNIRAVPEGCTDYAEFLDYLKGEGVDAQEEWRKAIQPRHFSGS